MIKPPWCAEYGLSSVSTNRTEEDTRRAKRKPRGIQPSEEEVRAQFAALFYAAVRRRDASKVRTLAKLAGAERWPEATRPLCDLLHPPSPKWRTSRHSKHGWPEARAAAIRALQQIDHPTTPRALVRALACDPDFVVRAAANAAVQSLGSSAIPSMVETVREQIDWDLDGMRALLTGFGDHADLPDSARRAAGIALMDVLYENFPQAPRRWTRPARRVGRLVAIFTMFMVILGLQNDGWTLFPAILMSMIPGQLAGFAAKRAASLVCSAAYSRVERGQLYAIAAQSIVRLNDKRAIPGMLQLAFDAPLRSTGRHACAVLLSLLPQVTERDTGLFSGIDIENVNRAVGQQLEPELILALLHTLDAVGNGSSIRRVHRIAKRSRFEAVRAAAVRTLEVLEAREARARLAQSLLRGALPPHAPAEEMLRAAIPRAPEQPDELLRPAQGEPSG